jgi:hypothetical protein
MEDYAWFMGVWQTRTWFDEVWSACYGYEDPRACYGLRAVYLSGSGRGILMKLKCGQKVLQNTLDIRL